jgi:outer membrane lipoprotein-sorting protein
MASTALLSAQSDARAKTLLDEVYNKINGYKNISLEFKYVLENKEADLYQETKGDMTVMGDLYRVNVFGSQQLYDGKKVYTIVPENEEVLVENMGESDATITPSKMLTFYREGYDAKWDILQNMQGRKIQFVKLIPQDAASDLKNILLGVDVATKNVYRVIEQGKENTKTTITVLSLKVNQDLPSNMFSFNRSKYESEGYYIDE